MFDEREALVAAIATNPDDDTPRLVFADWLQEHGEGDRAEFIRLECELARRYPECATDSSLPEDFKAARERSRNLLDRERHRWFGAFYRALGTEEVWLGSQSLGRRLWNRIVGEPRHTSHYVDFVHGGLATIVVNGNGPVSRLLVSRGFVDFAELNLNSRASIPDIGTAFQLEPVRHLWLWLGTDRRSWDRIDNPCLRRVSELSLSMDTLSSTSQRTVAAFESLTASENWSGVRALYFLNPNSERIRGAERFFEPFSRSPLLSHVEDLSLRIGMSELRQLARGTQITKLRNFEVWGCGLPPDAIDVLSLSSFHSRLASLRLYSNSLGDDGARRLGSKGAWRSLRTLDLGVNEISDPGVEHLLPLIPQLINLNLSGNSVTDAGALAIAEAIDPTKLESLWLSYNPLSPEVVGRLRERFGKRFHFTTREEDEERRRLGG